MLSRLAPLIKLLINPFQAMKDLAARRPYFFGAAIALISTFAYYDLLSGIIARILLAFRHGPQLPGVLAPYIWLVSQFLLRIIAHIWPVMFLIAVFVPACLLAASLMERRSSFGLLLRREYRSIVSCTLYAWAI